MKLKRRGQPPCYCIEKVREFAHLQQPPLPPRSEVECDCGKTYRLDPDGKSWNEMMWAALA